MDFHKSDIVACGGGHDLRAGSHLFFRRLHLRKGQESLREGGWSRRSVGWRAHRVLVVLLWDSRLLEKMTQRRLKLPVRCLQNLPRFVRRTAGRQHELVDHNLVFEIIHLRTVVLANLRRFSFSVSVDRANRL